MSLNINCQYCNKYLFCTHPTRSKFLGIFKRQCAIATGQLAIGQRCDLQKVFPEPDIKIGKKNESKKIKLERMDSLVKGAWIGKPKEAPILKKGKKMPNKKDTIETENFIYTKETVIKEINSIHPILVKNPKWLYECPCGEDLDWEYDPPVETFDYREYYDDGEYSDITKLICPSCKSDIPKSERDKMYDSKEGPFPVPIRTIYTKEDKITCSVQEITKEVFDLEIKYFLEEYKRKKLDEKKEKKMTIEKVMKAIEEAERFIEKAKLALKRAEGRKYFYIAKENASCRRASLDLTRALSEMRKY